MEWQINVANGEPLPMSQSQLPLSGHAFEARIYAENVPKGFLPATGVLHHYHPVPISSTSISSSQKWMFYELYAQDFYVSYLIEIGESSSPGLEVKVAHLGDRDFRVQTDGVSMDVSLAVYSKDWNEHIHIWHGPHHHYFIQKMGLELSNDDEIQHKPTFETTSHPPACCEGPNWWVYPWASCCSRPTSI